MARAVVSTDAAPREWMSEPLRGRWIANPLALDCAFQLMVLWSVEEQGRPSLPTFAARYRQFRASFPKGPVRVVARVTERATHEARADLEWIAEDGAPIARLEGYTCVQDPSLVQAFRRNRLDEPTAS